MFIKLLAENRGKLPRPSSDINVAQFSVLKCVACNKCVKQCLCLFFQGALFCPVANLEVVLTWSWASFHGSKLYVTSLLWSNFARRQTCWNVGWSFRHEGRFHCSRFTQIGHSKFQDIDYSDMNSAEYSRKYCAVEAVTLCQRWIELSSSIVVYRSSDNIQHTQ